MAVQMTEHLRNQNPSEASHQRLHAEVVELRKLSDDIEGLKLRPTQTENHDLRQEPPPRNLFYEQGFVAVVVPKVPTLPKLDPCGVGG